MNAKIKPNMLLARECMLTETFKKTLSLGEPMDERRLHWTLSKAVAPEQRLAFALAVYFTGGSYVIACADRGFLCVERIAQRFAELMKARKGGSYQIGHAFARLNDALGFGLQETIGFSLIQDGDLACVEGFIKGFSDSMRLSVEADVMRVLRGVRASQEEQLINLRHFIGDHMTVQTVSREII
jgi:hypothetical protein